MVTNKYMREGAQKEAYYPERGESPDKINFSPESVITISKALFSSGRLTKEQHERITTFITAKQVDEALEVLHAALEEKKEEK